MALGRMKQWREAQRQRAGGMVEIATWVPQRSAKFLKEIFARLADPSERGEDYRLVVSPWAKRRRVVLREYEGTSYSAEIDLPFLGPHWYQRPAGGRVMGAHGTWIELTPDEALEVSDRCRDAVSSVLKEWLSKNEMLGSARDHVGVVPDLYFGRSDDQLRARDSIFRPVSDDEFAKSEAEIAQGVADAAAKSRLHHSDDPTIVYYPGAWGIPSRCHAIHRQNGDKVLFALVHVPNGGTSPTNMIEELTKRMHKKFYPYVPFSKIQWFDAWRLPWAGDNDFEISHVVFEKGNGSENVRWEPAGELPAEFVDDIRRVA